MEVHRPAAGQAESVIVSGIAVTLPLRTALDGVRWERDATERVVFLDMMLAGGVLSLGQLTAALAELDPRAAFAVRRASKDSDGASRSPQETRFRMVWVYGAALSRPLVNARVYGPTGRLLAVPDLLDVSSGVVGEFDGAQHRALDAHTADNIREERLEAHGLIVVRATSLDLHDPEQLVRRIRDAVRRGNARDRRADRWYLTRRRGPFQV